MTIRSGNACSNAVFILGLHRSGTTWLSELLARSGGFNILTAEHVILFDDYLEDRLGALKGRDRIQSLFSELGLTHRDGEAVRLHADTPEEYGFVLDNHRAGLFLSPKNLPLFLQMADVIGKATGAQRRLLFKNPWDFGNGSRIKELIPGAKFVFIHRNPFHVLSSMYRLTVATVSNPSPYVALLHHRYRRLKDSRFQRPMAQCIMRWAPGLVVRALLKWVRHSSRGYLRSRSRIPMADRIDINYETLCQDPTQSMVSILDHLGVEIIDHDLDSSVGARPVRVAEPVADARKAVIRSVGDYAEIVGYDMGALSRDL